MLVFLWTDRAAAGPIEQLVQVAQHPSNPAIMVLRYINGGGGFFYTANGGTSWQLLCDAAVESALAPTALAIAGDGKVMIGTQNGLLQDDGTGCGWQRDPTLQGKFISDLVVHPDDPTITFAITATLGTSVSNGVLRRDATGVWSDFGASSALPLTRLQVVKTDSGLRFYASATKGANAVIRVSDDNAQTWAEYPITGAGADGQALLETVDPSDPSRVVVAIERPDTDDTILVSSDGGQTFSEYLTITDFGGVAIAPDGRVWIADTGGSLGTSTTQGIWAASSLSSPATRVSDQQVPCLGYQATSDTLYACERWRFGPFQPGPGCIVSAFKLYAVEEFVHCPGVDMATVCEPALCLDYCRFDHFPSTPVCAAYDTDVCGPNADMGLLDPNVGDTCQLSTSTPADGGVAQSNDAGVATPDAGSPDAGQATADAGRTSNGSGGCAAGDAGRGSSWTALLLAAGLLLRRRRALA